MAGRFMKRKKMVIPFMALVIMASQSAGCAAMTGGGMLKTMQESPEASIEWAAPDAGQQSLGVSHVIDTDGRQAAADSDAGSDIGLMEGQGGQAPQEISQDELTAVFEENYEISKNIYNSDKEDIIRSELEMIKIVVGNMDKTLPADYEAQYRAWRPSVTQQTQAAPEAALTFTEVNETVWAAGTVNLRSGPSTEDEKVGALNTGSSVTRTGIGTGDYASWSKVKLSDGTEAYAASNYLTTAKPASQSSGKPSGGSSGQGGAIIVEDLSGYDIVNGSDINKTMITDSSELDTHTSNPYSGYGEIIIGYGGK